MYCYNIGCGKTFEFPENAENSCRYHSEKPTFHDGRKGWKCCNKFSRDFSTCLSIPGCKVGYHNPVKTLEPEQPKIDPKYDVPVVIVNPIEKKPIRPSGDGDFIALSIIEVAQLRQEINKKRELIENAKESIQDGNSVAIGTRCQNKSCKREYSGSDTNREICLHHPGEAIFHEGIKFWTCCVRKTSDFDAFLAQEGCTSGKHCWVVNKLAQTNCRSDWFQTGSSVTISLYTKLALPESVLIKANTIKLSVSFEFECGEAHYEKVFNLLEEIDPTQSQVRISSSKVEIILKKKHFTNWVALEYNAI